MLAQYLFVYDNTKDEFPVRRRILTEGEREGDVHDIDALTGTVPADAVKETVALLKAEYPKPAYDVSRSWANGWKAIANNYRGMRDNL